MRKQNKPLVFITAFSVILLILLVAIMMVQVAGIQGAARVVNFAGILRGASQRLVKQELYGVPDDAEIIRLDKILEALKTGNGDYDLIKLPDKVYQERLHELSDRWDELKEFIYQSRKNTALRHALYVQSETYFSIADSVAGAAEEYADGTASKMKKHETVICMNIAAVIALFLYLAMTELHQNRRLKALAYIDENTGLPNKRSCEEKLKDNHVISGNTVTGCLMFDLNNLKNANDTMGHTAGDMLISGFATLLRCNAPSNMFIGRFGGDEFLGISYNTSRREIESFIEILNNAASAMDNSDSLNGIQISFAYGYALSDENTGCTVKTLMEIADRNMYIKKAELKSRRIQETK